jgi:hypothetical protein
MNVGTSGVLAHSWLLLIHQMPAKPAYLRVKIWRRLWFPKIPSGADSRAEAESAHHPARCSHSFSCLECLSPTCSGRGASLKSRTSFFAKLNIALRGAPHRPRIRGSDRALLVWMTWLWSNLSFPKIQSGGIGAVGQNQPTIRCDVCDHPSACNLHSQSVQVTTPA